MLDVGVRRIQIDREEWLRATQTLRRWLLFWNPPPRPAEAEESLAALLARREVVRSKQTGPTLEPNPDLFRPERPITVTLPGMAPDAEGSARRAEPEPEEPRREDEPVTSTTSRLLEAKRRAQQRKK